jgi:hypothetical protein
MKRIMITILIAVTLSGCDAITYTKIKVSTPATDNRDVEKISNEIFSTVVDTTTRFGFSKYTDENLRVYTSGKDTNVWVEIFPDGNLDEIEIHEMFTSRPSKLHRDFAEATAAELRTRKLDAKVFYQPPDVFGWLCLLVSIVVLGAAVSFVWRNRKQKRALTRMARV